MSQYNLKISDLYNLLIGSGFNLFIDDSIKRPLAGKRWNGTEWVLIYEVKYGGKPAVLKYYDGTSWVVSSIV
jgi:hypothetical protein